MEAHFALGAFYLAQRDLTAAETAFQAGAAIAPIGSPARVRLADFYLLIDRSEQAKKILKEITERAPDFLPAWQRGGGARVHRGPIRRQRAGGRHVWSTPLRLSSRTARPSLYANIRQPSTFSS